jgi:hypothetical protein
MRLLRSAISWFVISLITSFFFVGPVFLLISHADASLSVWNSDHAKNIRVEEERGTVGGLPIKAEARKKVLLVGPWGGAHISMQVTDLRTDIEYDCARATIDQKIVLDRRGRFDVPGTQFAERGGPVRQNGQPTGYPVRFAGQVIGKRMELSVRDSVTKSLIGNFTLVHGAEAKLRKCR